MLIKAKPSALRQSKWYEYAVRFFFGGAVTVMAGAIANEFGPAVGGLFLAFPAIFPASVTLVEKHERQKKENSGISARYRGRNAAGVDAAGAALGSIGLLVFAGLVWWLVPDVSPWLLLPGATLAWLAVSVTLWLIRKKM